MLATEPQERARVILAKYKQTWPHTEVHPYKENALVSSAGTVIRAVAMLYHRVFAVISIPFARQEGEKDWFVAQLNHNLPLPSEYCIGDQLVFLQHTLDFDAHTDLNGWLGAAKATLDAWEPLDESTPQIRLLRHAPGEQPFQAEVFYFKQLPLPGGKTGPGPVTWREVGCEDWENLPDHLRAQVVG